jgi:hypothetical protein
MDWRDLGVSEFSRSGSNGSYHPTFKTVSTSLAIGIVYSSISHSANLC